MSREKGDGIARCPRTDSSPYVRPSTRAYTRFWWELSAAYWDLPFFAEMGLCCEAMFEREEELAAREQLWAWREFEDAEGEFVEGLTKQKIEENTRP